MSCLSPQPADSDIPPDRTHGTDGRESRARRDAEAPAHAPDQERPRMVLERLPVARAVLRARGRPRPHRLRPNGVHHLHHPLHPLWRRVRLHLRVLLGSVPRYG